MQYNQGAKVANLFCDKFYPFMSYPLSAIANYYAGDYTVLPNFSSTVG